MVSVAMPYYLRQQALDRSLEAYRRIYSDLEISICDDGSPEPVNAPGCIVNYLPEKHGILNPCVPMNVAVRATTRDIVVLTNPEIEHREDVLGPMLDMMASEMDYVAAKCWDVDLKKWIVGPEVKYEHPEMIPEGAYFHMCAMLHRSLFEMAGGFDEDYRNGYAYEDADFLWRLRSVGANFKLSDKVVYHYHTRKTNRPRSNERLLRQKWGHLWA